MSHFAKVLDGRVVNVIVAEPDFFDTFIDNSPGDWIQTSYNVKNGVYYNPNSIEPAADQAAAMEGHPERQRKNFAGVGMIYDRVRDAFYMPSRYASWILNEDTCQWEPPIPVPPLEDSPVNEWQWDEATTSWIARTDMPV
jgi:hypothetical protein